MNMSAHLPIDMATRRIECAKSVGHPLADKAARVLINAINRRNYTVAVDHICCLAINRAMDAMRVEETQ